MSMSRSCSAGSRSYHLLYSTLPKNAPYLLGDELCVGDIHDAVEVQVTLQDAHRHAQVAARRRQTRR